MSTARANLHALVDALSTASGGHAPQVTPLGNALFVGSGDSLSACLLACSAGHQAASAGDIAWTGRVPPRIDTVVGVSHSGRTAATVEALRVARDQGRRTVAVTVHPDAALSTTADQVVTAADLRLTETIPAIGFLSLASSVLGLLGTGPVPSFGAIGGAMSALSTSAAELAAALPATAPAALSVLTLPDLRSAGDFWSLKLIEATGLAVRSVALEESGHVDYFVGPQPQLTLHLVGEHGETRHRRLADALAANGHTTLSFRATGPVDGWLLELATAALGAYVAEEAALAWARPPFRNHEVPMDARHIQVFTPGDGER